MSALLGILHGLDYVFTLFLLGTLIFQLLIVPAGGSEAVALQTPILRRVRLLLILSFISSSLWMILTAQDMADSWEFGDLWAAMAHTGFGHLWCFRILLLLIATGLSGQLLLSKRGRFILLAVAGLLPLFSSLSGHATATPSAYGWKIGVDWAHSVAAGIWSGGLFGLWSWLRARNSSNAKFLPETSHRVVERFSRYAMASTAAIGLSGLLMAYSAGVPLLAPWQAQLYGKLLIGKTLLFGAALLAASVNQFLHLRTWHPEREAVFSRSICREVGLEMALVLGVLALAGFLTRTALPGMTP